MKSLKSLAIAASLVCATAAQAVTTFQPTDGDVNFSEISIFGVEITSGDLYLFDNDVANYTMASGLKVYLNNQIDFNGLTATNSAGDTLALTGDTSFTVVLLDNGVWTEDISFAFSGPEATTGILSFGSENNVFLSDVQEVPVPAAAWLFGSAMLGLAGVKRRK